MKINSYIERIRINKLKNYNHIVIYGWAITENGEIPKYDTYVNGKLKEFEIVTIPRPDVCKKYDFDSYSLQCGFRLFLDVSGNLDSIQIKASSNEGSANIIDLTKEEIEKYVTDATVEYAIDGVSYNNESNSITVGGWAISYYSEAIEFIITDKSGNKIESVVRMTNREDLYQLKIVEKTNKYCGFMITFTGNKQDRYFLMISTKSYNKIIDLSTINKVSKIDITKTYIKAINAENVKKGVKYLKNNGIIEFLKRVKKGPGASQPTYDDWFQNHKVSQVALREQRNKKFIHLFPFEKNFISPNVAAGFVAVCINDNDLPLMPS